MLERFTEEEIAAIRKELKEIDGKSQKERLLDRQIRRVETIFPRSTYSPQGMFPASEIKNALFMICDHITNNYSIKTKVTARHRGAHYVRATCIPDGIAEKYYNAFEALVDVMEEWNTVFEPSNEKHSTQ